MKSPELTIPTTSSAIGRTARVPVANPVLAKIGRAIRVTPMYAARVRSWAVQCMFGTVLHLNILEVHTRQRVRSFLTRRRGNTCRALATALGRRRQVHRQRSRSVASTRLLVA